MKKDILEINRNYFKCISSEPLMAKELTEDEKEKGFLRNCLLIPKTDNMGFDLPPMFYRSNDGRIIPYLDGFAIIPMREYERLKSLENEK